MRKSLRALLAGTVLAAGLVAVQPTAEAATGVYCKSTANPAMAAKLQRDLNHVVGQYGISKAIGVYDGKHHLYCLYNRYTNYRAASTMKATILAALLYKRHGHLSAWEQSQARPMIWQSDNTAASNLYSDVGGWSGVKAFLSKAGMNRTLRNPTGQGWGGTEENANDELLLLRLLTAHNTVLTDVSRTYELGLMAGVTSSQRWGTPAGVPVGVKVHVKNGWDGPDWYPTWYVHSLGTFNGGPKGANYMMDIMTQGTSFGYGQATIEAIARVVHRDLNPGQSLTARMVTPTNTEAILGDGSGN
ncbi:MAG: secreted protein [Actinomycetia bacterium]|nr:secreted protein [Actinomycetes bacterium]